MKIGTLTIPHGLFLAPMANVTDHAFRAICVSYGAECVCTELISAKAVCYGDRKTDRLAALRDDERPAAIQIFGHEPESMARAAFLLQKYAPAFIDINFGCPMPKLVCNGDGSAVMRDPALCGRIVRAVAEAVDLPVTVKIRKGEDEACGCRRGRPRLRAERRVGNLRARADPRPAVQRESRPRTDRTGQAGGVRPGRRKR